MLMLLALAAAGPVPGPFKFFGDWSVACDNIRRCEAASLPLPAGGGAYDREDEAVSIVREPGPAGAITLDVGVGTEATGPATLTVDDTRVADGRIAGESFTLSGPAAEAAVRAMANGAILRVIARGKEQASASLTGMAATLRFIDAEQGRAGTVTALVARGAKPAAAVPAARPLPIVVAVRPGGGVAPISAKLATILFKQTGCDTEYEADRPRINTSAIGGGRTLALVPCGSGAYNFSSVPMILSGGKAVRAKFDSPGGFTGTDGGDALLVNAAFDAKTARLSSYAKGRGIGDCGSGEDYVWDGTMFRLVAARTMGDCRGSVNWLTIWRATAVLR